MNVAAASTGTGAPAGLSRGRPRHHPLFGGLLVKEGLINPVQLAKALTLQQRLEPRPLLGQILLDEKLITPHELNAILAKYQRTHLLGDVLIETNAITPSQLETALAAQRTSERPLGDTLIRLGFITERQLKQALSIQLRIAFVDLDARAISPSLRPVISERYARHHRAIPIAKLDDRLVLAMDDPTDVAVADEVGACTGHRVDVVTATADALERAFARLYGEKAPEAPDASAPDVPTAALAEAPGRGRHGRRRRRDARSHGAVPRDGLRARLELMRRLARSWERWIDAVEALLGERSDGRVAIARLTGELDESRAGLARATRELEAKTEALTRLELAHADVLREREALGRALQDLRERHEALLREIAHLSALLRRLDS